MDARTRAALVAQWAPAVVDGGRGVSKELRVKILFDARGPFFRWLILNIFHFCTFVCAPFVLKASDEKIIILK